MLLVLLANGIPQHLAGRQQAWQPLRFACKVLDMKLLQDLSCLVRHAGISNHAGLDSEAGGAIVSA